MEVIMDRLRSPQAVVPEIKCTNWTMELINLETPSQDCLEAPIRKRSKMRIFNIHDTIAPVIEIASDTLYMTSLEYATNGAESNIVSITDNCGTALGAVSYTH